MSISYGRSKCNHSWRERTDGYVEQCCPVVCIECGAFGCSCDVKTKHEKANLRILSGYKGNANINGKWINPYVVKKEK